MRNRVSILPSNSRPHRAQSAVLRLFALFSLLLTISFLPAQPPPDHFPTPTPTPTLTPPPSAPAPEDEEDILGPREKITIPVPEETSWPVWLSIRGGLLAAALLIWWLSRLKRKQIALDPAERALTELAVIDSIRNNLDAGPLADRSAAVVRRFVADRFGIAAPQRTTEEFLREVASSPSFPLSHHSVLLRGFLDTCDMAKFAGAGFDASERLTLLDAARRFIRGANAPAPQAPSPTVKSESA